MSGFMGGGADGQSGGGGAGIGSVTSWGDVPGLAWPVLQNRECSVCMENWTSKGGHRIVSLACGHLYGESCIAKWVKVCVCVCHPPPAAQRPLAPQVNNSHPQHHHDDFNNSSGNDAAHCVTSAPPLPPPPPLPPAQTNKRCPQCNQPAKSKDVRPVFVTNIVAVDGTALAAAEAAVETEKRAKQAVGSSRSWCGCHAPSVLCRTPVPPPTHTNTPHLTFVHAPSLDHLVCG